MSASPMLRACLCMPLAAAALGQAPAATRPADAPATRRATTAPSATPVAAGRGKVAELLRKWYAEGTAAGNAGDYYDNRDRGHSHLGMRPYPQLQKVAYTPAQRSRRADWGAQRAVLPFVVFGNSSTSAPFRRGGSNARMFYTSAGGLGLLYRQYTRNNLYIYPEHRDHDAGHNGAGGHGDVFPTNTPYLIASQGSSGSDRPFLQALPYVLAAFRPEVKATLVRTGLLMPTVQMIFRMSNRHLVPRGTTRPAQAAEKAYLTGKAHPTVFNGRDVDAVKMLRLAHAIRPDNIPPMIQLRVTDEDEPVIGREFFEPAGSEVHADTPCVIARIWRGAGFRRRIQVSAAGSHDVNDRPLTFHWAVLRGDPAKIRIRTMNATGSLAEITVAYHERRCVAEGAKLQSNRVDIGVFAHNGAYYSAPGFITYLTLNNEARTYDASGCIVDIAYGAGEVRMQVADWPGLGRLLAAPKPTAAAELLKGRLQLPETAAVVAAAKEYELARAAAEEARVKSDRARDARKQADEKYRAAVGKHEKATDAKAQAAVAAADDARKQAKKRADDARRELAKAARAADAILTKTRKPLQQSVKGLVEGQLTAIAADPEFHRVFAAPLKGLLAPADAKAKAAVAAARKRLIAFGLADDAPGEALALRPIRQGKAALAERLTRCEKELLRRYHAEVLSGHVYPKIVTHSWKANYVDPRLTAAKAWRDVYRYAPAGTCLGWTRYDGKGRAEFNAEGLLVLEKDALGRCLKARAVTYKWTGRQRSRRLKHFGAGEVRRYEYAGENDWTGRLKKAPTTGPAGSSRPSGRR